MANIMVAKVKDAKIHKAVIIDTEKTIYEAANIIKKEKVPTVLLKDTYEEMYIVTDSDFRQKVILNRMNFDDKVIKIASKGLIFVYEDDFLFNAQLLMAKHGIKRVVVKNEKEEIIGILDQISLSSFFAIKTADNQIDIYRYLKKKRFSVLKKFKINKLVKLIKEKM